MQITDYTDGQIIALIDEWNTDAADDFTLPLEGWGETHPAPTQDHE